MEDQITMRALKCSCRKSWCPVCGLNRLKQSLVDHVGGWDWTRVRDITLTVDPKIYFSPAECYDDLMKKRAIPQLIHNLKRTANIGVLDWHWVLEWHKSGFPHWHLLVLVDKPFSAGRIGQQNLHRYWPYGRLYEFYFETKKRFDDKIGYFRKHGYFDKNKKHQIYLPEWARQRRGHVIRRHGRQASSSVVRVSHIPLVGDLPMQVKKEFVKDDFEYIEKLDIDRDLPVQFDLFDSPVPTEGELLDLCGLKTDVWLGSCGKDFRNFVGRFDFPYRKFINAVGGEYKSGVGWLFHIGESDFDYLFEHFGGVQNDG